MSIVVFYDAKPNQIIFFLKLGDGIFFLKLGDEKFATQQCKTMLLAHNLTLPRRSLV